MDDAPSRPLDEQFVYERLPHDYFLGEAADQMDVNMAISDIRNMREGFIEYFNSQNQTSTDHELVMQQQLMFDSNNDQATREMHLISNEEGTTMDMIMMNQGLPSATGDDHAILNIIPPPH